MSEHDPQKVQRVIDAAKALRDRWRTPGAMVDDDVFFAAVHEVSEAADDLERRSRHPTADKLLWLATELSIAPGDLRHMLQEGGIALAESG
jgi:hypothetical protein